MKKTMLSITLFILTFSCNAQYISGKGKIVKVKDGDTFTILTYSEQIQQLITKKYVSNEYVDARNNLFVLRVANIDTAESNHFDSSRNTQKGVDTKKYVKSNFTGEIINFNCFKQGYYGRAICTVMTKGYDFGIHMIENGHSGYNQSFGKHPYMHMEYLSAHNNQGNKRRIRDVAKEYVGNKFKKISKAKELYNKYKELKN